MDSFDDTVYGGDFLANQPPVKAMTEAAPKIIHLLIVWALCLIEQMKDC